MQGASSSARCAACGTESPPGFKFCGACGAALTDAEPATETRRIVTVLFCDLVGSTSLGERLDPESVRVVVGAYFDSVAEAVRRRGGTVEKFIGDAVMAVFGVPTLRADDAERAVRCALDILGRVDAMNPDLQRVYGISLSVRIGITTGEVVAYHSSSRQRMVTGDTVNSAARLEQLAGVGEVLIDPATQALVRGIVATEPLGDVVLRGRSDAVTAHRALRLLTEAERGSTASALIGRRRERDRLRAAWEFAMSGVGPCLVLVVAGPGAGKTRTLQELARLAAAEGGLAIRLVCGDGSGADQLLATAVRELGGDARTTAAPSVADVLAAAEDLSPDLPLLLLVEDGHWADGTLLDLLSSLSLVRHPLLVAISARPEGREVLLARTGSFTSVDVVELTPLDDDDAAELVVSLLGGPVREDLVEHLVASTSGSPLFVQQTIAALREEGQLEVVDGVWSSRVPVQRLTAIPSVLAAVQARLDAVDAAGRALLEAASVLGESFAMSDLAQLAPDLTDPGTAEALVTRGLLVPEPDGRYRFWHSVVRDASYNRMLKSRRAELHLTRAEALRSSRSSVTVGLDEDEELATHLSRAAQLRAEIAPYDGATAQLARAAGAAYAECGSVALSRGETRRATASLRRCLELPYDDERKHALLEIDLAHALAEIGEIDEAFDLLVPALTQAREAHDVSREWAATWALSELPRDVRNPVPEDPAELEKAALAAVPLLRGHGDLVGESKAWRLAALLQVNDGRLEEARASTRRGAELAARAGEHRQRQEIIALVPFLDLADRTPAPLALEYARELLGQLEGNARCWAFAGFAVAELLAMCGRADEAEDRLARALDACRLAGIQRWAIENEMTTARLRLAAGRLEGALHVIDDALAAHRDAHPLELLSLHRARATIMARDGRPAAGAPLLELRDKTDLRQLPRSERLEVDGISSLVLAATGRLEEALELADATCDAVQRTDEFRLGAEILRWRAEVNLLAGNLERSAADADVAYERFVAKGDVAAAQDAATFRERIEGPAG